MKIQKKIIINKMKNIFYILILSILFIININTVSAGSIPYYEDFEDFSTYTTLTDCQTNNGVWCQYFNTTVNPNIKVIPQISGNSLFFDDTNGLVSYGLSNSYNIDTLDFKFKTGRNIVSSGFPTSFSISLVDENYKTSIDYTSGVFNNSNLEEGLHFICDRTTNNYELSCSLKDKNASTTPTIINIESCARLLFFTI